MLPPHLAGAVEFHDPARVNPAASLEENLLFGRISLGEANAEPRVRALVRRVLADEGLEASVYGLGLDSKVEIQPSTGALADGAINARERVAIELARCLAREPDILVVAIAADERKAEGVRDAPRPAAAGPGRARPHRLPARDRRARRARAVRRGDRGGEQRGGAPPLAIEPRAPPARSRPSA